jgi:hypothetical protein
MTSLHILSSLVYLLTLLTKHISAASRPVMSRFAVTHVSLPHSTVGVAPSFMEDHLSSILQMKINFQLPLTVSSDSSVGTATRYGLDGLGIESR